MAYKVNTSFKENDEEIKLYLEVMGNTDKSAFIKTALKFYLEYRHMLPTLKEMCAKKQRNKA